MYLSKGSTRVRKVAKLVMKLDIDEPTCQGEEVELKMKLTRRLS